MSRHTCACCKVISSSTKGRLLSSTHSSQCLTHTHTHTHANPHRRLAVSEALSVSPHVRPWTQAAMGAVAVLPEGPMRALYLSLGLKLIYGW